MSDSNNNSSGGAGISTISTILLVVFIVLKLCGVIAWSWWWVMAPLWGGILLAITIMIIVLVWVGIK